MSNPSPPPPIAMDNPINEEEQQPNAEMLLQLSRVRESDDEGEAELLDNTITDGNPEELAPQDDDEKDPTKKEDLVKILENSQKEEETQHQENEKIKLQAKHNNNNGTHETKPQKLLDEKKMMEENLWRSENQSCRFALVVADEESQKMMTMIEGSEVAIKHHRAHGSQTKSSVGEDLQRGFLGSRTNWKPA